MSFKILGRHDTPSSLHTHANMSVCVCVDLNSLAGGISLTWVGTESMWQGPWAVWNCDLSVVNDLHFLIYHLITFCYSCRWRLLNWPPLLTTTRHQSFSRPMALHLQASDSSSFLAQTESCEPRRTRVDFTAWRQKRVSHFTFSCLHTSPSIPHLHVLMIDSLCSYCGVHLRGTNNPPAGCQCSRKAGRIPDDSWLLDKQRKGPAHKGAGKGPARSEKIRTKLDASDQLGDHSASSTLFSLVIIKFHSNLLGYDFKIDSIPFYRWHYFVCFLVEMKNICPFLASLPNLNKILRKEVGGCNFVWGWYFLLIRLRMRASLELEGTMGSPCGISVAPFCVSDRFPPSRIQSMFFCNFFPFNVTLNKLLSQPSVFILFFLIGTSLFILIIFYSWFRHI